MDTLFDFMMHKTMKFKKRKIKLRKECTGKIYKVEENASLMMDEKKD